MRVTIWMNMPSHYQTAFFQAIRDEGIDLYVRYYDRLTKERIQLGWRDIQKFPDGEMMVDPSLGSLSTIPDWQDSIHIIPGYGHPFLRKLAISLSRKQVAWASWMEHTRPGWRWWVRYPLKRWHAHLINQHALGVFAISDLARNDFIKWGVHKDKIALMPYVVDPLDKAAVPDEQIAVNVADSKIVFLFIGKICHGKGIDTLIEAFAGLIAESKDIRLVLVGNLDHGKQYIDLVNKLGIEKYVFFRGKITAESISSALARADILVLPSRYDGWGVVLSEAASMGKALVATEACGGAHHLILDGENGYLLKSNDPAALQASLRSYIENPELAEKHGAKSEVIFKEFTPQKNAQRFCSTLTNWLGRTN